LSVKGKSMSKRVFIPGLSVFCALAMIGSISATAMAQQVPVRVIQGTDGTLYVVQGSNSWTLVPDQAGDSDVAALNPSGEIDGTFPNALFVVQAPAAPPVAAPAPAPAPPAAAPAPPAGPAPITGTANLTGQAASDVPGTPIAVGATISSVVDISTKPKDLFAIALTGGTNYRFQFSSPNKFGTAGRIMANVLNPDLSVAVGGYVLAPAGSTYCEWATGTTCPFTPATSATYYLQMSAFQSSGAQYTFTVRQV
jgi:hypothetical protein